MSVFLRGGLSWNFVYFSNLWRDVWLWFLFHLFPISANFRWLLSSPCLDHPVHLAVGWSVWVGGSPPYNVSVESETSTHVIFSEDYNSWSGRLLYSPFSLIGLNNYLSTFLFLTYSFSVSTILFSIKYSLFFKASGQMTIIMSKFCETGRLYFKAYQLSILNYVQIVKLEKHIRIYVSWYLKIY